MAIKKKQLSEAVKSQIIKNALGFSEHMYNKCRATFTDLNNVNTCGVWQLYNAGNIANRPSESLLYGILVTYASMGFVVQIVYHHLENRAWRRHKSDNTNWGAWQVY